MEVGAIFIASVCDGLASSSENHKSVERNGLFENLRVLCQFLSVLQLQVDTFFKYWLNTHKYHYHYNTGIVTILACIEQVNTP